VARLGDGPEGAGFGNCAECARLRSGPPSFCFACANETIEQVAAVRCPICDGSVDQERKCHNTLCNRSEEERGWEYIYAISMRSGKLREIISRYKYDNRKGWAGIFGRLLVGYLEEEFLSEWDLIIPMPTYIGEGGRQ
jgi:predicted amidophosphoribosyltransferase